MKTVSTELAAAHRVKNESSAKKPKKRHLSPAELSRIEAWLILHDLDLYGRQAVPTEGKEMMAAEGIDVDGVYLGSIGRRVCKFWLNNELDGDRRKARRLVFDGTEWHRMQSWIRQHRSQLDLLRDTNQSVSRRMRHSGIICNPNSVHEALKTEGIDLTANPVIASL